jgi:hypothetical protein
MTESRGREGPIGRFVELLHSSSAIERKTYHKMICKLIILEEKEIGNVFIRKKNSHPFTTETGYVLSKIGLVEHARLSLLFLNFA